MKPNTKRPRPADHPLPSADPPPAQEPSSGGTPVWSTRPLLLAGFIGVALTALTVALRRPRERRRPHRGHARRRRRGPVPDPGRPGCTPGPGSASGREVAGQLQTIGTRTPCPDSVPRRELRPRRRRRQRVPRCRARADPDRLPGDRRGVPRPAGGERPGLVLFFLLAVVTGGIFHRAIRQVFAKSRKCPRRLGRQPDVRRVVHFPVHRVAVRRPDGGELGNEARGSRRASK